MGAPEPYVTAEGLRGVVGQLVEKLVPVIDERNADAITEALESYIPVLDQRAADIAVQVFGQMSQIDSDAVTRIAADVAQRVADDTATRVLQQVDSDTPAMDVDRLRHEVIEDAMRVVRDYLPQLVAAAQADTVFDVVRDRDGKIRRIESKPRN